MYLGGEELLVVELLLDPGHEIVDVLGRRAAQRLLDRHAVHPVVLVARAGAHDRARVGRAKLGQRAVQHVDLVEKVHGCEYRKKWKKKEIKGEEIKGEEEEDNDDEEGEEERKKMK